MALDNFMSKRNFILLIIILVAILAVVFGFLYFREPSTPTGTDTGGTNFFSDFNPFDKSTTIPPKVTPPVDISGFAPPPETEVPKLKLQKVSSMPIAGFAVFQKERLKEIPPLTPPPQGGEGLKKEFMPALRYVARANGNIYQTFANKIEEKKFSTTIIPKVYEAYFGNKGESVIMRYLKIDDETIETFVGILPKEYLGAENNNNEIKGSFLPDNIKDISISPNTLKIFYLLGSENNTIGVTANALGSQKIQIFDSSFTEWLSLWPNANMITLTTKASALAPGYMYAIDQNKKSPNNISKILGEINGLTTLTSPNGKLILYNNSDLALYVYNISTREESVLGIRTLPEKCVWTKTSDAVYCAVPKFIEGALYPDAWYQGEISFSDEIWKIDVGSGQTTILLDPMSIQGGEDTDGIKLALDEAENYLFFVNKKDSYLWELNLK